MPRRIWFRRGFLKGSLSTGIDVGLPTLSLSQRSRLKLHFDPATATHDDFLHGGRFAPASSPKIAP